MAYSNTTTNYNLPIYSAGDIASWTDTNQPFEDIDAATHTAYQTAASAAQDVTTLDGTVTTLSGTVAGHTSTLSTLTTTTIPALQNAVLGAATANGTSYSNTSSGLVAEDVQDAIDEVYTTVGDLIKVTNESITNETVNANTSKTISISATSPGADYSIAAVTVLPFSEWVVGSVWSVSGSSISANLNNLSSTTTTVNGQVRIVWVKTI